MHRVQGEKKFRDFLEGDREFIMKATGTATERANDAGPISLGIRLETDKDDGATA